MKSTPGVFRGTKATATSPIPDTIGNMPRYTTGGECYKCGQHLAQKLERHVEKCETFPSAEEINEILKDPLQSIQSISKTYKAYTQRITGILLKGDNDWTREKLKKHGYIAKVLNEKENRKKREGRKKRHITVEGPRCVNKCGVMVIREGGRCKWCVLESVGIKSYRDIHGI